MRTLVVYYSRSGSTAMIAGALALAVGATMRELVDRSSRAGLLGRVLAALAGRSARLVDPDFDVSAYETIVLLTPEELTQVGDSLAELLDQTQSQQG